MRNEIMYLRWTRNICIFFLIASIIIGAIGWYKYKEERIIKEGLERLLGNMFEPLSD